MKKFMLSAMIGVSFVNSVWAMEESVAVPQEVMVSVETNDDIQQEISLSFAKIFKTLDGLIQDLGTETPIPLSGLSSQELKLLLDVVKDVALGTRESVVNVINERLHKLSLEELLIVFRGVEFLDPQFLDDENKPIDFMNLVVQTILKKIKESDEPDKAIAELRERSDNLSADSLYRIAQALLIDARIIYAPFTSERIEPLGFVDLQYRKVEITKTVPSSDGRLAIVGQRGVFVLELDGRLVPIDLPEALRWMPEVAWSSGGRLAVKSSRGVVIRERDGSIVSVDVSSLKEPEAHLSVQGIVWSLDEQLAVYGGHRALIRSASGEIIKIDVQDLEWIHPRMVSWSPKGQLVMKAQNGFLMRDHDGAVSFFGRDVLGWLGRYIGQLKLSWSQDGWLAITGENGVYLRGPQGQTRLMQGRISFVGWSPDGRFVFLDRDQNTFNIEEPNGQTVFVNTKELGPIKKIKWSSDGRLAILGERGVLIRERDGGLVHLDNQTLGQIYSVAWSSDEQLAISGSKGTDIWSPHRSVIHLNIVGGSRSLDYFLAWSSDGRLAIGSDDAIFVRERNGKVHPINIQGAGHIDLVAWLPDGQLVISARRGVIVYHGDIPEEYKNLTLDQALLIIKLARMNEPRILNHADYERYILLPDKIKERYPLYLNPAQTRALKYARLQKEKHSEREAKKSDERSSLLNTLAQWKGWQKKDDPRGHYILTDAQYRIYNNDLTDADRAQYPFDLAVFAEFDQLMPQQREVVRRLAMQEGRIYLTFEDYELYRSLPDALQKRYKVYFAELRGLEDEDDLNRLVVELMKMSDDQRTLNKNQYQLYRQLPAKIQKLLPADLGFAPHLRLTEEQKKLLRYLAEFQTPVALSGQERELYDTLPFVMREAYPIAAPIAESEIPADLD